MSFVLTWFFKPKCLSSRKNPNKKEKEKRDLCFSCTISQLLFLNRPPWVPSQELISVEILIIFIITTLNIYCTLSKQDTQRRKHEVMSLGDREVGCEADLEVGQWGWLLGLSFTPVHLYFHHLANYYRPRNLLCHILPPWGSAQAQENERPWTETLETMTYNKSLPPRDADVRCFATVTGTNTVVSWWP